MMVDYFKGKTEEEAIANGKSAGIVEFEGDENCNDFEGGCAWDGQDRRCVCDNRRVYWATEKQEDGTWIAHGEAW